METTVIESEGDMMKAEEGATWEGIRMAGGMAGGMEGGMVEVGTEMTEG